MEYKEFRVIVRNRYELMVIRPSGVRIDGKVPMDTLRESTILMFNRWLSDGKITTRGELEILGSHLYEGLFDDEVRSAFREEWEKILSQSGGLRLVLEFEADARELAEMPWEYIFYYPGRRSGRGYFLATVNRLILARHVPLNRLAEVLEAQVRPLRILIVVSEPERDEQDGERLGTVIYKPVIEDIEKLRSQWPGAIVTDTLFQPTKRKLTNKVDQFRPHVLHFIGHGRYTHEGRYIHEEGGSLALVKEDDESLAFWITDIDLADCFVNYQPRLIFLHACEGASSKSYRAFRGVALQLVYSRVPAVVAMQYQVENRVAIRFARIFYQSLGEGKRVDEAVQAGRLELGMYLDEGQNFSSRAFGSPVVYLQSAEGIIIAEAQGKPEISQPSSIASAQFKCPNCKGLVTTNQNYCRRCGTALMLCPNCRGEVMFRDGFCGNCGYGTVSRQASERIDARPGLGEARESLLGTSKIAAKVNVTQPITGPISKKPLS